MLASNDPLGRRIVAFGLFPLYWAWIFLRRWDRRRRLVKESGRLGFVILPDNSPILENEKFPRVLYLNHPSTNLGRRGARLLNVIRGLSGGMEAWAFEFSARDQGYFPQSAAAFRLPGSDLPLFQCRPKQLWSAQLGRRYETVASPTGESVLLNDKPEDPFLRRLKEGAMAQGLGGWTIEGGWDWLILYRAGRCIRPESLTVFLMESKTMLDRVRV